MSKTNLKEFNSLDDLLDVTEGLLEALEDLVMAHKIKMGVSSVNLRIELAKDAINKATVTK